MQRSSEPSFAARLLRQELVPSVGCTEPAALALAAAAAASRASGKMRTIRVRADMGTYKNSLSVGLPGCDLRGPPLAAAAGALIGDPSVGLAILGEADHGLWSQARRLVDAGRVEVTPAGWREVRIEAAVTAGSPGKAVIQGRHDRLDADAGAAPTQSDPADELSDEEIIRRLDRPQAFIDSLEGLGETELYFIAEGLEMNRRLALTALDRGLGWSLGRAFQNLAASTADPHLAAKSWVSAGIEARMDGEPLKVMTSGGSGNSGITVTLGIWAAGRALGNWPCQQLMRAIALGHLVNVAVKARIGRVGPLCGGAIASAMGVGCGLAWLLGGREREIDRVTRHVTNSTSGTVCDGAKPGCALKVSAGLSVAIDAARLAVADDGRIGSAGLGGVSGEQALVRLQRLSREAFSEVDQGLVAILTGD